MLVQVARFACGAGACGSTCYRGDGRRRAPQRHTAGADASDAEPAPVPRRRRPRPRDGYLLVGQQNRVAALNCSRKLLVPGLDQMKQIADDDRSRDRAPSYVYDYAFTASAGASCLPPKAKRWGQAICGTAVDPVPVTQSLHPPRDGVYDDELLLVQVTRFACGSYVVGYMLHHLAAHGHAMATTMAAFGEATRGPAVDPVSVIDRAVIFAPRNPFQVEFEHRGAEFKLPGTENACSSSGDDEVVVQRVRFTRASISSLKSRAAGTRRRQYSAVQCVVAHLWRCITAARRLRGSVVTMARVAVNGRARMRRHRPPAVVPQEYVGNVVLWARPAAAVSELTETPLGHAAELVARAVAHVDDRYFRSFVDFASSGAVEAERLAPTADAKKMVLNPDVEVYSLLAPSCTTTADVELRSVMPLEPTPDTTSCFLSRCRAPRSGRPPLASIVVAAATILVARAGYPSPPVVPGEIDGEIATIIVLVDAHRAERRRLCFLAARERRHMNSSDPSRPGQIQRCLGKAASSATSPTMLSPRLGRRVMVAADGHAMGPGHPRRRLDPVPVTESKHGNPLCVDFEHRGVELKLPGTENESSGGGNVAVGVSTASISSLKSIASPPVVQRAAGRGGAYVAVHHRGAPARRERGHHGEWLVPTPDAAKMVLSPDVEVYSLLGFAFRDIDFCSGVPFFHMRGYVTEEDPALHRMRLQLVVMPSPSSSLVVDDELLLVQLTRFKCGSYVVGYTLHHLVADGHAMATTMVAFGQATCGIAVDPVPVIDRSLFFAPRNPPRVEFEHRGAEFKLPGTEKACGGSNVSGDEVVVHRVRFTRASISSLKSMATPPAGARLRQYSTVQCVVAHLWRCITAARRLGGRKVTVARVAVNGRARMRRHAPPAVPQERRMDDAYFRPFIDFAGSGAVAQEGLVPTADTAKMALSPDVEVYSLLGFAFRDIDFGSGAPFFHMRGYVAEEGLVFLVSSLSGDGSVYAYVNLFRRDMDVFKDCCYSLLAAADSRL
ncbi:hypothetical protein EJB05_55953, partial [Eragrostis curvula]